MAVLAAVWAIGWFVMPPAPFAALGDYMLAGAAFVANILTFAQVGYFDAPAATKPLLHLWSLGVEEQFYLIFPAAIALAWRFGKIRSVLLLLGALSLLANLILTRQFPSFAFYLPLTRLWEFVAGALLAEHAARRRWLDRPAPSGPPSRLREIGSFAGLAAMLIGFVSIRSQHFPGWPALLPVLGATLVIAAGPRTWLSRKALADPRLRLIGLFSYPLYLWHWPLLVIGRAYFNGAEPAGGRDLATTLIAVALAFALAWATYRFIERPVRARRPLIARRRVAAAAFASVAALAVLGLATARTLGFLARYPASVQALLVPLAYGADFPPLDQARNHAGPLVATYGDSHAAHLQPGLRLLQRERTFRTVNIGEAYMGWSDCAPVGVAWGLPQAPEKKEACKAHDAENERELEALKPDVLVLGAFWRQYDHLDRLGATIEHLHQIGVRRVVIMGTAPFWAHPPQSLMYEAYQADPWRGVPTRLSSFDRKNLDADRQLKTIAADSGAVFISAFDVFCNDEGCLTRLGDQARDIVQIDLSHYSAAGSSYLIQRTADQIFGAEFAPLAVGEDSGRGPSAAKD